MPLRDRLRRDPGLVLLGLALALAAALYAPTLGRGLVNLDDTWLIQDNHLLAAPSWRGLATIFLDLRPATRLTLGAEYLPVRDLSIMLDRAVWGAWYPGFHLVNLALYLAALPLAFAALTGLGAERRTAGVAVLLWAVLPTHAESVAWLSERKGLLALDLVLVAALGHARFRAGRGAGWLALATVAGVAGVWSKATAAFGLAALAGLELVLPDLRRSWRRSLTSLAVIGAAAFAAFVPVVLQATGAGVVGAAAAHGARLPTAVGIHGFYLRLSALLLPCSVSYPIALEGPTAADVALGALGLATCAAALALRRAPREARAGAVLWLAGWLPASQLILPLQLIVVADRYLLQPSLGLALAVAAGLVRVPRPALRAALIAALVAAATARACVAQATWASPRALWANAVAQNPADAAAWSSYAEALAAEGEPALAQAAVDAGLARRPDDVHLALRQALLLLDRGARAEALGWLRRAAEGGNPRAMSNLALLQLEDGDRAAALAWARRAARQAPALVHTQRTLGKVALAAGEPAEARAAFAAAVALAPTVAAHRYNLALALLALRRPAEALAELDACAGDPRIAPEVAAARAEARRQLAPPPR